MYAGKHAQIQEREVKLIATRARELNNKLSLQFEEMNAKIRRTPKNIEELTETREYMLGLQGTIETQKKDI